MRNTYIKNLKRAFLVFSICIMASCSNDDDNQADCGCNSDTIYSVPDENLNVPIDEQETGVLFFKNASVTDEFYNDEEYSNRFWIIQGDTSCYNCYRKFIICNESILGEEFQILKNTQNSDSIPIKFSGEAKMLCLSKIILSDYDYKEITLISISTK